MSISAGNSTNSSDHNRDKDDIDGDVMTVEHPVNADGYRKYQPLLFHDRILTLEQYIWTEGTDTLLM